MCFRDFLALGITHSLLPTVQPGIKVPWGLLEHCYSFLAFLPCGGDDHLLADTRMFYDVRVPDANGLHEFTGTVEIVWGDGRCNPVLQLLDAVFLI